MTLHTIETALDQRTPAWFQARLGRVTGSRAKDMLATVAKGEAAARRDYRTQLVLERLTGLSQEDGYINPVMQRGIDCEPAALAAYEALTGLLARPSGFVSHPVLLTGCSVDGVIGDPLEGILELKCPKSATHLKYLRQPLEVPPEHLAQITHNLWVTGATWCDFLSFDDRFPPELQTVLIRVQATDLDLSAHEEAVVAFLADVDAEYQTVLALQESRRCRV